MGSLVVVRKPWVRGNSSDPSSRFYRIPLQEWLFRERLRRSNARKLGLSLRDYLELE